MSETKLKLKLGFVLDKNFHEQRCWTNVTTFYLVEAVKGLFDECVYIQNQSDYEQHLGSVDVLVSMEPGWGAPVLELARTPALHQKLSEIPSYVFYSDPHGKKWRQEYFLKSGLSYVLAFYYAPTRYHFPKIPPRQIIHFPWGIPDDRINSSPIIFHGQNKICCFGGVRSKAYDLRNWCRTFDFVDSTTNSGCENKQMSDIEYVEWLASKDAAIAAGSDSVEYRLTVPKYFEIPSAGALLFAQQTEDLKLLGFKHNENCVIFNRENFEEQARRYLANPQQYMDIRKAGRELVRERHTLGRRMEFLQRHITMVRHGENRYRIERQKTEDGRRRMEGRRRRTEDRRQKAEDRIPINREKAECRTRVSRRQGRRRFCS